MGEQMTAEVITALGAVRDALQEYAAEQRRWVLSGKDADAVERTEALVMSKLTAYGTARVKAALEIARAMLRQPGPPVPLVTRGDGPGDAA